MVSKLDNFIKKSQSPKLDSLLEMLSKSSLVPRKVTVHPKLGKPFQRTQMVRPGEKPPEGVQAKQGSRGGYYYETKIKTSTVEKPSADKEQAVTHAFEDLGKEYAFVNKPFEKKNISIEAFRAGDISVTPGGIFFASDEEGAKYYSVLHRDAVPKSYHISLNKALIAGHQNSLCQLFFNKSYADLHYELSRKARSEVIGGRLLDQKIRKAAQSKGYTGIIYTKPAPPAKMEVAVFNQKDISLSPNIKKSHQSNPPYPGAVFSESKHRWVVPKEDLETSVKVKSHISNLLGMQLNAYPTPNDIITDNRFSPVVAENRLSNLQTIFFYANNNYLATVMEESNEYKILMPTPLGKILIFRTDWPEPVPSGLWMDWPEESWNINNKEWKLMPVKERARLEAKEQLEKWIPKEYYSNWLETYAPKEYDKLYWSGLKDLTIEEQNKRLKPIAEKLREEMLSGISAPIQNMWKLSRVDTNLVGYLEKDVASDTQESSSPRGKLTFSNSDIRDSKNASQKVPYIEKSTLDNSECDETKNPAEKVAPEGKVTFGNFDTGIPRNIAQKSSPRGKINSDGSHTRKLSDNILEKFSTREKVILDNSDTRGTENIPVKVLCIGKSNFLDSCTQNPSESTPKKFPHSKNELLKIALFNDYLEKSRENSSDKLTIHPKEGDLLEKARPGLIQRRVKVTNKKGNVFYRAQ